MYRLSTGPRFASFFVASIAILIFTCFLSGCTESKKEKAEVPQSNTSQVDKKSFSADQVAIELTQSGWTAQAAYAVTELNATILQDYFEFVPDEYEKQVSVWKRLGEFPEVMSLLEIHPETAGLLAGATNPRIVADSLDNEANFLTTANLYQTHVLDTADDLAEALNIHESTICHLVDKNFIGVESLFIFPREDKAIKIYDEWIAREFEKQSGNLDSESEFVTTLAIHGKKIRELLIEDSEFAERFIKRVWPRYVQAMERGQIKFGLSLLDSNLFHLLALDKGDLVVEKWGNLSTHYLFGSHRLPEGTHRHLIEVLLIGDNETIDALERFKTENALTELLCREDISIEAMTAAINKAGNDSSNSTRLLRKYAKMGSGALTADVGPPPSGPVTWLPLYDTYQVAKKLAQGRDLDTLETVCGVADPVLLLLGPLNPSSAVKVIGKKAAQETVVAGRKKAAKKILTASGRKFAKEMGEEGLESSMKRTGTMPWRLRETFKQTADTIGEKVSKKLTFEVTGPVQASFSRSGVGLKNFKRLTDLDARIFMRSDRRVVVRLDTVVRNVGLESGAEISVNALAEKLLETEAVQDKLKIIVCKAMVTNEAVTDALGSVNARAETWKQNASTWWNINATGAVNDLRE